MAFESFYKCEFETIKGRIVSIDLQEDRLNPDAIFYTNFGIYTFVASQNYLQFPGFSGIQDFKSVFKKYDKITVNNSVNNNFTFTIKKVEIDTTFFGYTRLYLYEPVVEEGPTINANFFLNVTKRSAKPLIASSESPLEISYPNGEFEKMCPIRESRLRLKIINKDIDIDDFRITSDTQIKIIVNINNNIEWVGWLDNDYLSELFLDTIFEIELTANDGISLLKTKELRNTNNTQVWGAFTINQILSRALYWTKLDLNIYTYINMYPIDVIERSQSQGFDAFDYCGIMAHTFIKGPRDFDDCYDVLSKIMQSFGCTLFQSRGSWYIIQTNDRVAGVLDGTIRNASGNVIGVSLDQNFKIDIGLNEVTKLIDADAILSIEKGFKEVKIKHSFDFPEAYFRNFDLLDRFDPNTGLQPAFWTAAPSDLASFYGFVNDGNILIEYQPGTSYEIRRFLSLTGGWGRPQIGVNAPEARQTTQFYVNSGDVISFSYKVRYSAPYFEWDQNNTFVRFETFSGQSFYLNDDGSWQPAFKWIGYAYNKSEDRRFWKDYSIKSQPVPDNGFISIILSGQSTVFKTFYYPHDIYYMDLNLSIESNFIDQNKIDGHEYKCFSNTELRNTYDNQLFISNAPNRSTKGSLLDRRFLGNAFQNLTPLWYYKGNPGASVPFSKYITRTYWRTMYRNFLRMEGRVYDLYQNDRLLSPLNTIEFTEIDDKEFMLTTINMDVKQESAECTMIELRNTSSNADFTQNGLESYRYLNVQALDEDNPVKEPKTPIDWRFGAISVVSSLLTRRKRRRFNNYS